MFNSAFTIEYVGGGSKVRLVFGISPGRERAYVEPEASGDGYQIAAELADVGGIRSHCEARPTIALKDLAVHARIPAASMM